MLPCKSFGLQEISLLPDNFSNLLLGLSCTSSSREAVNSTDGKQIERIGLCIPMIGSLIMSFTLSMCIVTLKRLSFVSLAFGVLGDSGSSSSLGPTKSVRSFKASFIYS